MREVFQIVKSMYDNYNGMGMHMALFFACIIYLILQKKEKEKQYLFAGYTLLFFIICFCPLTAKIIMDVCIGQSVYWRMFWLLPTTIVTAYTAVQILMELQSKNRRYLMLVLMLVVVMMTGTFVYNGTMFHPIQNRYKLPQDVIEICDTIEADAAANGIEKKKLITVNEFLESVRQYDANILMPYGNNATKGLKIDTNGANEIYRIMCSDKKNWSALSFYAAMEECNYLAYPADDALAEGLKGYGYEKVGGNASYYVYRQTFPKEYWKNQWLITQHGGADGNQLMFYTLQDMDGHVIVVDGGWTSDADYVRKELKSLGNRVDAWIITHPHRDHAGAFCEIYKDLGKLKVKQVYAVDMASPEKCLEIAPWDETEVYEQWEELSISNLNYVHAGDVFEVAGLKFEIFNAYDAYVDELSGDLLNDGSMMFKVSGETESMLFCADVGKGMSDYLLETYKEGLQADYIQMGHHGNGGLKHSFYEKVGAKAAFFDAPKWLMEDTSGHFTTMKNAAYMAEIGADIYSFATAPNEIVLK